MAEFWDLIVRSNTFNFIIMLIIITIIWQKLSINEKLDAMKIEITNFIKNSETEREKAQAHLKKTEKSVENLDHEIKTAIDQANISAQNVFEEIQNMAKIAIKKIEANIDKIIDNEKRKATSRLSNATITAATERAKNKLEEMFAQNPQLHEVYTNQSIEALDRIKL